ncbi:glycosyltransferase [Bacteroides sp.]|uniref:glycosyltransferase family 32 protein n=1 Tax=Bacteroides sp. TaxID=29523 RepID=UPI001B5D3B9A|nr:glycosyltransferase [Bacteroides sp.]MBP6064544.1 glycosyl transferase [Bacteroides sp.]MBP6066705.1 glycosyl transferase [Bacteroides sp.]MBP6935459.1 glycosyl transferase [Bacteroides sp.]MBP9585347.1 glycosyl transferase [Bacteroides sp.]
MIPKIVHYCWLSKDPFPDDINACLLTWKKHLPDYEFKLWDFSNFDIESSVWVKEAYLLQKYAFAADYIRFYALYNEGGIYLDCDVEVVKPFDDLLHLPYFIGRENTPYGIEAATIGFEKGHPLLLDLLNYYKDRKFVTDKSQLDILPLPAIMLECINRKYILEEIPSIKKFNIDIQVISILPIDYFSPKTWDTKELNITANTYSIHHFAGSWKKKKSLSKRMAIWRHRFLGLFMQKYRI